MDSQISFSLMLCIFGIYGLYIIRSYYYNNLPTTAPLPKTAPPPTTAPLPKTPKPLENVNPNLYIYIEGAGRLGNLLTQYAATEGLGFSYNRITYYSERFSILKELFFKVDIKIRNLPGGSLTTIVETTNKEMVEIEPNKNVTLEGYFQNYFYFNNITNLLLTKLGNFTPHINYKVQKFIADVNNSYFSKTNLPHTEKAESVCIQVRRGDFLTDNAIISGRTVANVESIQFAMEYMRKTIKNIFFIFISNEIEWCKTNFQNKDIFHSEFSSSLEDFVLASSCHHSIMTVGTYGWWSSWLTAERGGIVMYFKKYFEPNSPLSKEFGRHVWFPGNWLAYTNSSVSLSKYISQM